VTDLQGSEVSESIFSALEREQDKSPRPHLGCSILGRSCQRQVWYIWRWAKAPDFKGRILRLFRRGHEEEPWVVKDLRAAGMTVHESDPKTGRQFTVSDLGGHLGGSIDGAVTNVPDFGKTWMVLEIKTSGAKPFAKLVKQGVKKAKPEHWAQMLLYMRGTGMRKALYLAVCKDNDAIHTEVLDYVAEEAEGLISQAKGILQADAPPPKISEHSGWWECKFCDHWSHCHGEEAPDVNCRTCLHSTPVEDPDRPMRWTCSKHEKDLTQAEQLAGCPDHRYIPHTLPFAAPIDSDPKGEWVEYKSDQGVYFSNGYADNQRGYSSEEIRSLGSKVLIDDPILEGIRKHFGPITIKQSDK